MSTLIQEVRQRGERLFERHGIPHTRLEHWKYTDIRRAIEPWLAEKADVSPGSGYEALPTDDVAFQGIDGLDAYRIRVLDGRVIEIPEALPEGVIVQPLARLLADDEARAARILNADEQASLFNGLVALNTARAQDGVVITVEAGIELARPILIQHMGHAQAAHICHALELGAQAHAMVIEHYETPEQTAGFTNVVSRVQLGSGSSLVHVRLQQESSARMHIGRLDVCQQRDSLLKSHVITLGAQTSRLDLVVNLNEAGASCELNGLYLTAGRQHADHHTVIEHRAPYCRSREEYRGILDGRSRAVFNGRVVVHEGAVGTDSEQRNANLLLSDRAEIDTKPELEIYNDDVRCAHGATVGQLDEAQLFYMKARGLDDSQARELLTFAFADEVLVRLDVSAVRRHIERLSFDKLPYAGDFDAMSLGLEESA
ncbi:MAG: Fe-S cluster assembly protein SufD [Zetaproteobacteria bacterium]|nr:MAG: Fe-S cluster assembly protein SufD [Zetaproteobacteria bacterium]